MNRRELLSGGLALLLAPPSFASLADRALGIALLQHGDGDKLRPSAVEQLMWELSKRTSINVREHPAHLKPLDPKLFDWPLLLWLGSGPCPPFSEAELERLSRFLRAGGSLFVDDISPLGDDRFDLSFRREMRRLWPQRSLEPLSNDHTLFRSFFLLERAYGRVPRSGKLEGIWFDDRSPVLYSRNDLFGAFGRDPLGGWLLPVTGGKRQREMAFRMGINLVMYASCLNYKRDQVHVTAILRRRRWQVDPKRRGQP